MNIAYTAQRSLISGHTAGVAYDFDVNVAQYDRAVKSNRLQNISLDQSETQTLLHGIEEGFTVRTVPVLDTSTAALQMREFLDSALDGQEFVTDLYGTTSTADDPIAVTLDGDYAETRQSIHLVSFSFRIRKAL